MTPEVFDVDGTKRDLIWLKMNYGAWYVAAQGAPGQGVFRLAQIHITEGPAVVKVRVQNQNTGLPNHAVAFYWPDAPDDLTDADVKTIYKPRADVQWTDSLGYTGYGVGTGSYINDIGIGGPHALWILHDKCPSDAIDGVGMLPGTTHRGPFDLVFDLRLEQVAYASLNDALRGEAERHDVLPLNETAALWQRGVAMGLHATSDEFLVVWNGVEHVGQRFRRPGTHDVVVLYCVKYQHDRVFALEYVNNA